MVGYDDEWPSLAARTLSLLRAPFEGLANRFEHIGSTAIPGMAAKDVLDLQISVADLDAVSAAVSVPLEELDFRRSSHVTDHLPTGTVDDPDHWSKLLWLRRSSHEIDVNLHVRRSGSPNERVALLFRDWLRAHPTAVPAYASFKMVLAGRCPDTGTYAEAKDPVVDLVLAVAEEWAETVGWSSQS